MSTKAPSLLLRGISLIELIMFIVIISVMEMRMCINPEPRSLSGMLK